MSTLIVLAKAPVPGRVKTRLCPPFTPEQAALLAAAALQDTLTVAASTDADHRLIVLDGVPDAALLQAISELRFTVRPQAQGGLDARIAAAFAEAARLDQGPAVLIGMDTPQASASVLDDVLRAMDGAERGGPYDAAFGPADDGGFWALGLREPGHARNAGLLLGVPMSQPDTGARQLQRLQDAGLKIAHLPMLRDIDTADCAYDVAEHCPNTAFARALAAIDVRAGRA